VSLFPDIGLVPTLILAVLLAAGSWLLWSSGGRDRDDDDRKVTLRLVAAVLVIAMIWILWSQVFHIIG
jgi:hypothetical protein